MFSPIWFDGARFLHDECTDTVDDDPDYIDTDEDDVPRRIHPAQTVPYSAVCDACGGPVLAVPRAVGKED